MSHVRKLEKLKPVLAYRKRGLTAAQFDALTERTISEACQMSDGALEDARSLLAALPEMCKLDEIEGEECERYAFAFLHMRAMEVFREKANPMSLIAVIEIVTSDTNSAKALLKHAPHRRAREFVRTEWGLHHLNYDDNKSAFARDYVRRVWNEMRVSVTEKQLREVWLRDAHSAGEKVSKAVADRETSDGT